MSTQAAEQHEKAAEQYGHTARHYQTAAEHHKVGNDEKAVPHAQATDQASAAAKSHA